MDYIKLKAATEDYANVLSQYSINRTTDRETLKDMFKTVLTKFVKKEYFYTIIGLFLDHDWVIEDIKKSWESCLKEHLNNHTFQNNPEYTDEIIETVKKFYKIK